MGRSTAIDSSGTRAGACRRALRLLLAVFYVFVCVTYQISCIDEVVASKFGTEQVSDASGDKGAPSQLTLCDHCPTCSAAVVPTPLVEARSYDPESSAISFLVSFSTADLSWLDAPPPKA